LSDRDPPPETPPEAAPVVVAKRRRTLAQWAAIIAVAVLALVVVVGLTGRWVVLSGPGRDLVSGFVNGKKLGRYGRINVYGLRGDLWSDFTLDRVTVTDAKGVWLDARKVRVDWTYSALIGRRFHADLVQADVVRLIRRPELEPSLKPPGPLPLAVDIDRIQARVELLEGFSKEYGRWTLEGSTRLERKGGKAGRLRARSLTRPGDFLRADFDFGGGAALKLDAEAYEAQGGPIAGALGYSPDQPFVLSLRASGKPGDGRFYGLVKTGALTPLQATGAWTRTGATASGRMAFSGSDLLLPFAARLGGEARFGLAVRPARGGRYALAWVLLSDNLTTRAQGLIDPRSRASIDGIGLSLDTPSLTRLTGVKSGAAARFEGRFVGDPYDFRLRGTATVAQPQIAGYRLASAGGPIDVRFRNGRYDAEMEARGAGGAGRGVLAGLLGARPSARAKLTWFPDGSLLVDRFQADGAGLKMTGSGRRGIGGGLSFQGKAAVSNFGAIRKGAGGVVDADFRASRPRGTYAWKVNLDARGRRFATGLGQLDRLLGASPRLTGTGSLDHGRIAVAKASLAGKAGRVNGAGLIGLDGGLKLALDWTAKGPFAAGPVEIAGDARGSGALTGTIAAPRADLKATFDQIDIAQLQLTRSQVTLTFQKDSRGYDGRIALLGSSAYGPARARSDFRFTGDGVRLDQLSVDAGGVQADGSLALRRGAPSSADLRFAAGPGAFIARGHATGVVRITDGPADALAAVEVNASDLVVRGSGLVFNTLRLSGQGTLGRLPFAVTADVGGTTPVKFAGSGVYSRIRGDQAVALNGQGSIRGAAFKTNAPLVIGFGKTGRSLKADLEIGAGRLLAAATQTKAGFDARADLTGVDLRALNPDVTGKATAVLVLNGRGARLDGSLDASFQGLRARQGPRGMTIDGTLKADLDGDRLHVDANATGRDARALAVLDLPVAASAAPLRLAVVRNRPLSGRYEIAGEVRPIWDLLMGGGERSLAGQVNSAGRIAGTLNAPLIDGAGSIRGGRFEDAATGLVLREVTADARFDRNLATISQFSGVDTGKGRITGEGRIDLRNGGASTFTLSLQRFQLIDNDIATARASGPITVTRAANGQFKLQGKLRVDRAEVAPNPPNPSGVVQMDVVEINAPPGRREFKTNGRGIPVQLEVDLDAPNQVFIQGRGLDVEMSLDAHVGGTTAAPILTGTARVVRGDFQFAGKRFEFDDRGTVTLSTRPDQIRLNLRATRDDPTLTAVIQVKGTAAKPEIVLTSSPALPQDEVLAQVLFGRSASQLSALEAAQLASSVASLSGGGGFDVLGNLRELAGLDRLAFGGDQASGLTVAGGKYVADNVYLELIGGGREGPAVEVQWRVKRQVSVISRITGQGNAKLSVRWRKDLH
jgi:translocation and assembly module TamB